MRENNSANRFYLDAAFQEKMLQRKAALEKLIGMLSEKVKNYPEGTLRIVDKKSYFQYYWRKEACDTNGTYIPKEYMATAKALAQKDYEQRVLAKAKEEYKFLSKYWEYLLGNTIEDVYADLHRGRKMIVTPLEPERDKMVEEWLAESYETMPFTENTEFYTGNEVRVRSKSELIIANLLEQYGVPYKYESPLYLRGLGQVRPDFTCLNVRLGKEYVWEHFGMMDNAGYAIKNTEKLSFYQQNGYFSGKNMIATFETSQNPLSSKIIKGVIEEYLL